MNESPTPLSPAPAQGAFAMWHLEGLVDDTGTPRHIPLTSFPFRVGRRRESALCLPIPTISKDHAELCLVNEALVVRDLNSTNGTFVNGNRVDGETPLKKGDCLHFSNLEFHVGSQAQPAASATAYEAPSLLIWMACQFEKLFDPGRALPYFQPIVALADKSVAGYEVLARSNVSELENPREMFLVASRLKLEGDLSRLFRQTGVVEGGRIPGQPNLFLNTHPNELSDSQLLDSLRTLREQAPGQPLTLEIHESSVTNRLAMKDLRVALRDLDIGVAYDDFGSGQDRLLDLIEVPPDYVKFDARFVRGLDQASPARQQTVAGLVSLVRDLGIAALAEGVETEGESRVCEQIGFQYAQGFHYGRPEPVDTTLMRVTSNTLSDFATVRQVASQGGL